jgi:cytochrome c biogenesis protein CcmG, thiol:disulfide interchange protein DsbE
VSRRLLPIFVSILGACLVGLLIYGISHQAASRTLDEAVHLRKYPLAPDAGRTLPLLSGTGTTSLASFNGKIVVLNFWASWCEPCQEEAPLLEHAQHSLERHDGTVLGVTYKDITSDSLRFVRQYNLTYPNIRDGDGDFASSYGTDQLPETFVIDRRGHIVAISRGEIDQAFLNRAIALASST